MSKTKLLLITLFLGVIQLGWSQKIVTGTVTDDKGTPILGANVLVKDTNRGTTTDFDGKFTIEVSSSETLVFSSLGFTSQTILVGDQISINITMTEEASALAEVVVTGYSTQSTRDITGSVSIVKAEDLEATSPLNVEEALQGQSSGVVVGNQGGPGQGAVVRIRGYGTINGNDPLYIIDGTPTGAGLTDINPNDIESVQVLKDASSAAIYGNRAANGVIIITTKSGKRNSKINFSANAYVGVDFIPNSVFPDLASPQQLADAIWQAATNDGTTPSNQQYGNGANPLIPVYLFPQGAQTADESSYNFPDNRITRANSQGTDWFDEYFNAATIKNFNISASGGSENSRAFMSLSALDQEGVAYETDFLRYTLRANSSFNVTDRFRIGENVTISYAEQTIPPGVDVDDGTIASLYRINPLIPVRDIGGNFAGSGVGGLGNGKNPIAIADRNKDNAILTLRALGNFYGEFDVVQGLTFKSNLGFDLESINTTNFEPASVEGESPTNNLLTESSSFATTYTWFNTLTYTKTFGEHTIDILTGTEFNKQKFRNFGANRGGFIFDDVVDIRYLDLGTTSYGGFGNGFITSYFSAFGKADYKLKDRYLLSATVRYDSSSIFSKDNRDGVFPSFSAGWRVTNESFLEDSNAVNDLMLKVGYGITANNGSINATSRVNTFSANTDFFAYPTSNEVSAVGYGLGSRGNPDLEWETTTTFNIGITSKLFNALDVNLEYYNATTEDMLLFVPDDPTVLGQNNGRIENLGEMNNKGFDASLGYSNPKTNAFTYNVSFNISSYKNEVVFLDEENLNTFIQGDRVRDQLPNRTQAGQPLASFYGKVFTGIGPDGRMQFANNGEQQFIGNPHPDFTYGLNFNAAYKNFDFSLLLQGSQGNDLYNFMKFFTDFNTFPGAKSINYVTQNGLPALTNEADIILAESAQSSFYIEDGSYVRLKNIVIGYSIPEAVSKKLGVQKIRWYLQGRNLITLTDYTGLDPEVNLRNVGGTNPNLTIGLDSGVYPINRSIIFGFNVSF
ncbi:TonB-dependent receptor [Aquimarina sp. AD10]|uniref:SusC/RagA family TonB-linked outer membrane protein n=1 Tax=Aquimarina sp. AD10 TaxID=1714849 RepID=UPI000E4D8655|nr:TonB-dependent receptor [Aquimarina sp. AD10]AXT62367.1 TonB-dependent receptor [Aquimarina sp. AD10]RKM90437.1 SusC/RagA family TonB-linked outer membrane protein [Aquimarina sp. AD10]